METARARAIAYEVALKLGETDRLPECNGCPEGTFEERVDRWLKKLANLVGHRTFLKWNVCSIGVPPAVFVLQAEQGAGVADDPPRLEFPIARLEDVVGETSTGQRMGRMRRLVLVEPEGVEDGVPSPPADVRVADRDRVGELLEAQALLRKDIAHLQATVKQQGIVVTSYLQRMMMLTSHFGQAPWFGTVTIGWLTFQVQLQRPGPDFSPTKDEAAGKAAAAGRQ